MPLKHTIQEVTLDIGAKGLIVNVPDTTVVNSTIHFRAGNDFVARPDIHQTAHLMEHMAFGPNEKFSSMEAFSQEFSRNGAYSNASTFDTNMHYYADCAQFEWERILRLQQLAITKPRFLPEILATEQGNVREELTGQAHNNPRVMWQAINRALGGHSFSDLEKIETIDAVTVEDIVEHHQRTHTHSNLCWLATLPAMSRRHYQSLGRGSCLRASGSSQLSILFTRQNQYPYGALIKRIATLALS